MPYTRMKSALGVSCSLSCAIISSEETYYATPESPPGRAGGGTAFSRSQRCWTDSLQSGTCGPARGISAGAVFASGYLGRSADLWAVGCMLALGLSTRPIVPGLSDSLSDLPYRAWLVCCPLCGNDHAPALGRRGCDCCGRFPPREDMTRCKCTPMGYSSWRLSSE